MNSAVLLLLVLDFTLVAISPRIFFKPGALNLRWWLTSAPVGLCPIFVAVCLMLHVRPEVPASWLETTGLIAVVLFAASIGVFTLTVGTHRVPISLWHQTNDDPQHIVTWGAYRRVRHPFYLAYLLAFTGALLAFPYWGTLVFLVYMVTRLNALAAREEAKLSASTFGNEYRQYITRTGRFLPPVTRRAEQEAI